MRVAYFLAVTMVALAAFTSTVFAAKSWG